MFGVGKHPLYRHPHTQNSEYSGRRHPGQGSGQAAANEKDKHAVNDIHHEQAGMYPPGAGPQQLDHQGVDRVNPRQFHIIEQGVGWNTLEQKLTAVGIFPFITFQSHTE